jgi:hypothetical protein
MQIAPTWPIPKVVMRVNNRLRRIQDFFLPRGKPILSDGLVMLHLML